VLISEKLWNSHVITSITSQSKCKLECLRESRLIISHLQKFAHKISPTLCPKTCHSFKLSTVYIWDTQNLSVTYFFMDFWFASLKTETSYLVVEKLV